MELPSNSPGGDEQDCNFGGYQNILHDPKYPKPGEEWYYKIARSCWMFSINSRYPKTLNRECDARA